MLCGRARKFERDSPSSRSSSNTEFWLIYPHSNRGTKLVCQIKQAVMTSVKSNRQPQTHHMVWGSLLCVAAKLLEDDGSYHSAETRLIQSWVVVWACRAWDVEGNLGGSDRRPENVERKCSQGLRTVRSTAHARAGGPLYAKVRCTSSSSSTHRGRHV